MQNKVVQKLNLFGLLENAWFRYQKLNLFGLLENAWFPLQPITDSRMGVPTKLLIS